MDDNKKCSVCQIEKSKSCFGFKNKKLGRLHNRCKECQAVYHKIYYKANKETYIEKSKRNNSKYKKQNKTFVDQYKENKGCKFCGETCSICLDFHHKDPTQKDRNISRMKNSSHSIKAIKKEIHKCIVVCSNCHRKLHAGMIQL
jgi:hypothetical protein